MKVEYITVDPLRYPRIKKIAYSLRKRGDVKFHVMIPKIRLIPGGSKVRRVVNAVVNYLTVMLQVFFVKADVFWVANCPDILVIPLVFRRKRYVLEYRSPWAYEVENEFGFRFLVYLASRIENLALRRSGLVTLTTSKLMVKVKDYGKPVFVIPNYPLKSFGALTISRRELRGKNNVGDDDKVVLFVGKLTRMEGADMLPRIIEDVLRKTDVVFWIVGDGPLYSSLERFAKSHSKNIKLFGWQSHEKIPEFIAAADVCISPRHKSPFSIFYNDEGLQKLSEYMFFEKPIVTCGIAASTEYLLVEEDTMGEGILAALNGRVPPSKRRTWDDYSEQRIYEMLRRVQPDRTL